jgi:hypothetical protein
MVLLVTPDAGRNRRRPPAVEPQRHPTWQFDHR